MNIYRQVVIGCFIFGGIAASVGAAQAQVAPQPIIPCVNAPCNYSVPVVLNRDVACLAYGICPQSGTQAPPSQPIIPCVSGPCAYSQLQFSSPSHQPGYQPNIPCVNSPCVYQPQSFRVNVPIPAIPCLNVACNYYSNVIRY